MANLSEPNFPAKMPQTKVKGKTKAKHRMIAELIARGVPLKDVAQKVNLSASQIYHLSSDADSFVNAEIHRILSELFAENDRHLINLYSKALQKLDTMLSSSDEEKQYRATDRIIKMFSARIPKNTIIQQYFGDQLQTQKEFTMDDYVLFSEKLEKIILQRRKERGLPLWQDYLIEDIISKARKERGLSDLPDHYLHDIVSKVLEKRELSELPNHESSSNSAPEANAHSFPENPTPGNSALDAPSQGDSSQGALTQEQKDFLDQIT